MMFTSLCCRLIAILVFCLLIFMHENLHIHEHTCDVVAGSDASPCLVCAYKIIDFLFLIVLTFLYFLNNWVFASKSAIV